MKGVPLVVGLLFLIDGRFAAPFCQSASQTSHDLDLKEFDLEAELNDPAKSASETTDRQVDIGATNSATPKSEGTSIAQPPRALTVASSPIPTNKSLLERNQHFAVAIDI